MKLDKTKVKKWLELLIAILAALAGGLSADAMM